MLRARRSASRRVSSSTCRMMRALSWRSSSSSSRIRICFAWPGAEAGHALQLAQLPRLLRLQLLAGVVEVAPPVLQRALALGRARASGGRASPPSPSAAPRAARSRVRRASSSSSSPSRPPGGQRDRLRGRSRWPPRAPALTVAAAGARRCGDAAPASPPPPRLPPRPAPPTRSPSPSPSHGPRAGHRGHLNSQFVERCGVGLRDCADGYGPSRALLSGWSHDVVGWSRSRNQCDLLVFWSRAGHAGRWTRD